MIEELRIRFSDNIYKDYDGTLRYTATGGRRANLTGWLFSPGDILECSDAPENKEWYINGRPSTAIEVFETLSNEDKEKAIWELD